MISDRIVKLFIGLLVLLQTVDDAAVVLPPSSSAIIPWKPLFPLLFMFVLIRGMVVYERLDFNREDPRDLITTNPNYKYDIYIYIWLYIWLYILMHNTN